MAYSLVGATALGYDLARLPHGDRVAQVLRVALRCDTDALARLAAQHPGPQRDPRWAALEALTPADPMTEALPLADEALRLAVVGRRTGSSELLERLESALLGTVGALDRLVRRELLDWTWLHSDRLAVQDPEASLAADVLVDAAGSAFAAASLSAEDRRRLAAPYVAARLTSVDDDPGTGRPDVDLVLSTVAGADAAARDAWRSAVDRQRPVSVRWAPAMHDVTWGLHLTGRLRPALDAQLAAVTAFRDAGFTRRDAAHGVWNAFSGAVQAVVARDVVGQQTLDTLLGVWCAVHGPRSLPTS